MCLFSAQQWLGEQAGAAKRQPRRRKPPVPQQANKDGDVDPQPVIAVAIDDLVGEQLHPVISMDVPEKLCPEHDAAHRQNLQVEWRRIASVSSRCAPCIAGSSSDQVLHPMQATSQAPAVFMVAVVQDILASHMDNTTEPQSAIVILLNLVAQVAHHILCWSANAQPTELHVATLHLPLE